MPHPYFEISPRLVVVVSGPVAAGKSTFADRLVHVLSTAETSSRWWRLCTWLLGVHQGHVEILRTKDRLLQNFHYGSSRLSRRERLQELGELLDGERHGLWVAEGAVRVARRGWPVRILVVDAIRRSTQIDGLKSAFPDALFFHVHLTAPFKTLSARYEERAAMHPDEEFPKYEEVRKNETEAGVDSLRRPSNASFDTSGVGVNTMVFLIIARLLARRARALTRAALRATRVGLLLPAGTAAALAIVWFGVTSGSAVRWTLATLGCLFFATLAGYAAAYDRRRGV